jgi:hypothetical protein
MESSFTRKSLETKEGEIRRVAHSSEQATAVKTTKL